MSRETTKRKKSEKKNGDETSEGIVKCICRGRGDDKGMMIQCEACLIWLHTRCLDILETELPSHFICNECLSASSNTERDGSFAFVSNKALREELEANYGRYSSSYDEKARYRKFNDSERQLIDKFFGFYVNASDPKEKEEVLHGLAALLQCSVYGVGNLFKFVAEEMLGEKDDEMDEDDEDDPYKDWNLIKKNIYSAGIDQTSSAQTFDVDMQEPTDLSIHKYGNDWAVMLKEPVEKDRFLAEYLGVWLKANVSKFEDSPLARFVLLHPDNNQICVDSRFSGGLSRFIRRSCTPNAVVKEIVGPDSSRRLGIFALEPMPANVEVTIAFDRPWRNYLCSVKCCCGSTLCAISMWYEQRTEAASKVLAGFRRGLTKLKTANQRRSPAPPSPSSEDDSEEDQSDDEDEEDEVKVSRKNSKKRKAENVAAAKQNVSLSREERKLQSIMKSIEKMEKKQKSETKNKRKIELKNAKKKDHHRDRVKRVKVVEEWDSERRRLSKEKIETKKVKQNGPSKRVSENDSSPISSPVSSSDSISIASPTPPSCSPPPAVPKFGKKAWLQGYEEKQASTLSSPTNTSFPLKKKMLGAFLSSSNSSVPCSSPSPAPNSPITKPTTTAQQQAPETKNDSLRRSTDGQSSPRAIAAVKTPPSNRSATHSHPQQIRPVLSPSTERLKQATSSPSPSPTPARFAPQPSPTRISPDMLPTFKRASKEVINNTPPSDAQTNPNNNSARHEDSSSSSSSSSSYYTNSFNNNNSNHASDCHEPEPSTAHVHHSSSLSSPSTKGGMSKPYASYSSPSPPRSHSPPHGMSSRGDYHYRGPLLPTPMGHPGRSQGPYNGLHSGRHGMSYGGWNHSNGRTSSSLNSIRSSDRYHDRRDYH